MVTAMPQACVTVQRLGLIKSTQYHEHRMRCSRTGPLELLEIWQEA